MKNFFAFIIFIFVTKSLFAQCELNPTITPDAPILCPGGTDTLWTEEFESYQWLKGNNVISGATNQFYVVTESDVLKKFKVVVTDDDCTDTSASGLVDAWVFLLPDVIQSGDMGYFDPQLYANVLCAGDTMILTMGLPYQTNVQWYDNGNPISGATNADYYVTSNGSFTACGSPDICPNYTDCMLIPINVVFGGAQPAITMSNDTLFSTEAESYQWYLDGNAISGATDEFYAPTQSGDYTVGITDEFNCSNISEPFSFAATGLNSVESSFEIFPNPANEFIKITLKGNQLSVKNFFIQNSRGEIVFSGMLKQETVINVSNFPGGMYLLIADEGRMMKKFMKE